MTKEQAINVIQKKYPGRNIAAVGDEGKHFIIDAPDPKIEDEIDPYFAVDKKTGEITNYAPGDLIAFAEMMGYGGDDEEDDEIEHSESRSVSAHIWSW